MASEIVGADFYHNAKPLAQAYALAEIERLNLARELAEIKEKQLDLEHNIRGTIEDWRHRSDVPFFSNQVLNDLVMDLVKVLKLD